MGFKRSYGTDFSRLMDNLEPANEDSLKLIQDILQDREATRALHMMLQLSQVKALHRAAGALQGILSTLDHDLPAIGTAAGAKRKGH